MHSLNIFVDLSVINYGSMTLLRFMNDLIYMGLGGLG